MSATDIVEKVEIPWLPGSLMTVRSLSIKDERYLLGCADHKRAYEDIIRRCVTVESGFEWDKDYSSRERDYLLAKIRILTYGGEMLLSGYECPHCGHKNSNHLVNLVDYELYPLRERLYIDLTKSMLPVKRVRVAGVPLSRVDEIIAKVTEYEKELLEKDPMLAHKKKEPELKALSNAYFLELTQLGVFVDYTLDELIDFVDKGYLHPYDVKKASHMILENPYGFNYDSTMVCHFKKEMTRQVDGKTETYIKECGKEFNISLNVVGSGFLVPYFGDSGGNRT